MSALLSDLVQVLDDLTCVSGVEVLDLRLARDRAAKSSDPVDVIDVHAASQADAARLARVWGLTERPQSVHESFQPGWVHVFRTWEGQLPGVRPSGVTRHLRVTGGDLHPAAALRVG